MARDYTKVLVITANVGSIFEDPEHMLQIWIREFLATVKRMDPDFLAVHCQEVGGKNYEESMQHVNQFVKTLLASEEMQQFDKARVFLDEDFTAVDKFTALGSLYFIHQSIQTAQIWDWRECKFLPVIGREVLSGNIETVSTKEKAKFPQEFFPDHKWSRKGFIRTRWNICTTLFDLVNIHLFHDASNFVAMESSPSIYSENRKRAMLHTLERYETDEYATLPYIIFGDFNFRLDSCELIKKLTDKMDAQLIRGKKNDVSKIVYSYPKSGLPVLTLEKKSFDYHENHSDFSNNNNKWLQEFDKEPSFFFDRLYEYNITFPPSYPFSEEVEDGTSYMKTRCPSWCDRILLHRTMAGLLYQDENDTLPEYNIIGPNVCMGDHKPIYLNFKLRQGAGKLPQQIAEEDTASASLAGYSFERQPVKKVISINGEEVDSSDMADINIHDYATFETEEVITPHFMSTLRRKATLSGSETESSDLSNTRLVSFRKVALEVVQKENVLLAMKHYSHRSDSESEVEEEENNIGSINTSGDVAFLSPSGSVTGTDTSKQGYPCPSLSTEYENDDQKDRSFSDNNNIPPDSLRYPLLSPSKVEPNPSLAMKEPSLNSANDPSEVTLDVCSVKVNHQKLEDGSSAPKASAEDLDFHGATFPSPCPCDCVVV